MYLAWCNWLWSCYKLVSPVAIDSCCNHRPCNDPQTVLSNFFAPLLNVTGIFCISTRSSSSTTAAGRHSLLLMKPQPESGLLGFPRAGDYSSNKSSYQQNVRNAYVMCIVHLCPSKKKKTADCWIDAIKHFPLHTTHELAVPSLETNLPLWNYMPYSEQYQTIRSMYQQRGKGIKRPV